MHGFRYGCSDDMGYFGGRHMHWKTTLGVRRGDFRFLVLIALSEKPMHGYALIQEIGRAYQRPVSAGLVYPTLRELEDQGYIASEEKEGKKIYSLTSEGKKYLEDNKDIVERIKAGKEYTDRMGTLGFIRDIRDIQMMVFQNEEYVDEEKMNKIREILAESKKKVASVIFE
jgi:DNA-binding PadR family transcriptional regulator